MVREAKRLWEETGIGTVEQLTIHMASVTRELLSNTGSYPQASEAAAPEQQTWTDPVLSGGGYGQAQLSHALGLALWLTGLQGEQVFAMTSSPLGAPVELHDAVAIRFTNGAIATMSGGSSHLGSGGSGNKAQLDVRAIGSEGQFQIDLERELVRLFRAGGDESRPTLETDAGLYDCDGPPNALVDLALGREVDNCSPGELGARTVEILDAIYRSARSGEPERVDTSRAQLIR
jgi:predicted dehydrogenase